MHYSRHIAIILSDTLHTVALCHLLNEYFPPVTITTFASFEQFNTENHNDHFHYYITTSDTFFSYMDFFLPRKNKTLVLLNNIHQENKIVNYCIPLYNTSQEYIIEQIELLFVNENATIGENNKELSQRETSVLQLIVSGITNKEVADKLNISLNTVLTHRKNITAKLGIKTVSGLTFYAIMNGLISREDIEL